MKKFFQWIGGWRKSTKWIWGIMIWFIVSASFFFSIRTGSDEHPILYSIANIIATIAYMPAPAVPFVIGWILWKRKRVGEGKPLSIEAMRESRKTIPNKIYKFCSLSTEKKEKLNSDKLKSLRNNQVWVTGCDSLNDPFEGITFSFPNDEQFQQALERESEDGKKILWQAKVQLESQNKKYAQASFSKAFDNTLMWGYYANGCRGYCVEYEVKDPEYLFPAQYLDKRIIIDWVDAPRKKRKLYDKNLRDFQEALDKATEHEFIQYVLYFQSFKSKQWEWEQEIRAIDYGMFGSDFKGMNCNIESFGLKVSKIIIGYRCIYKKELIEIAKKLKVPYTIMKPSYADENYHLIEVNN